MEFIEDVHVTPLKIFTTTGGQVMRGVRKNDIGLSTFGEAYFTSIDINTIRGWKLHKLMISNLIVPVGSVKFVLYDNRTSSKTFKKFQEIVIGSSNYCKLLIPTNVWFAFKGICSKNLIFNLSNITHNPKETLTLELNEINYDW